MNRGTGKVIIADTFANYHNHPDLVFGTPIGTTWWQIRTRKREGGFFLFNGLWNTVRKTGGSV